MSGWQTFTVRVRSRNPEPTTAEELHEMLLNFVFTALDDDDVEVAHGHTRPGPATAVNDHHLLDMDGKPLNAAALCDLAANWLDTLQDAIDVLAGGYVGATSGDEFVRAVAGTEVQDDLRRAAKALRLMPNNDWAIFAHMKENP